MTLEFPTDSRALDYWRVSSYGYPCFFGESEKSQEAWSTLLTFFEFSDYAALKKYWNSKDAPRLLTSHAVESWKATFEEFGLLYVESRSNQVTITPAGAQLREAAERNDETEFAWIGLNLLLRYPLRGPRRPKSELHRDSDLLIYRFLFASMLDLDEYFWWTELERILCRVFQTEQAINAVHDVRVLRTHPELISHIDLPVAARPGGFYNSLNQVAVHAGMNHLLLGVDDSECPYGVIEPKRKQFIRREWLGMIRRALSNNGGSEQCMTGGSAIARIPSAPIFLNEGDYFEYLGAKVRPMASSVDSSLSAVELQGDLVFVLSLDSHFLVESPTTILGNVAMLCQLARGQRLILSHDEKWTYIVVHKELVNAEVVRVEVRRARPISNIAVIRALQGAGNV